MFKYKLSITNCKFAICSFLLVIACCFLSITPFAQQEITGRTIDKLSREPLAFVAVIISGTPEGTYSDIDGYFQFEISDIQIPIVEFEFRYLGYETQVLKYNGAENWVVEMQRSTVNLAEVIVRPGENPAERIIRLAIANKEKNNPESEHSFTYDSYNKLLFTAALDSAVLVDEAKYNSLDTNQKEVVDFLKTSYFMMMESVSRRKYMPPGRSEETIIATRVSGLQHPDFALLGTQLQSFSFYGEMVNILDYAYLSPLAHGSISKYLFIIEDTTLVSTDTVFTISYRPRKGKNFEGMKGQLFINTNGYALQNVIAEPAETASMSVKIQQQYDMVEGRQWFPVQLNSQITMPFTNINGFQLMGIGRSYLKNIELDAALRARDFTPITMQLDRMATRQPDSLWNVYRERELDSKELRTYHLLDSVGKAENLDAKLKIAEALMRGKIPWGKVNFDLNRLMNANSYEGFRLGIGVHTSDKLSQYWNVGAYYAWGFKDKAHKYGTDVQVHINRKRNAWLRMMYENDVAETGGNRLGKPAMTFDPANFYSVFVSRMDRYEKKGIEINLRAVRNVTTTFFGYTKFTKTFEPYSFTSTGNEGVQLFTDEFNTTETGITVRYAPGEKLARAGHREVRLGGRFPVFHLRYTKGLNNFLESELAFERFDLMVEKTFHIKNIGDFSINTFGGLIEDDVPLSWLYNARGAWGKFTITAPMAFETMRTNEFQHSRFAAIHLRHNFRDLLIKGEKFRPQIILVHSMMVGDMKHIPNHNIKVQTAGEGYFESGIQIDRLYKSVFSALGIGVFYRYGPYHLDSTISNFAFKLSSTFAL